MTFRMIVQLWNTNTPVFVSCDADQTENYMYISIKFGTGVHVFCSEVGVFNRSSFQSVSCKHIFIHSPVAQNQYFSTFLGRLLPHKIHIYTKNHRVFKTSVDSIPSLQFLFLNLFCYMPQSLSANTGMLMKTRPPLKLFSTIATRVFLILVLYRNMIS